MHRGRLEANTTDRWVFEKINCSRMQWTHRFNGASYLSVTVFLYLFSSRSLASPLGAMAPLSYLPARFLLPFNRPSRHWLAPCMPFSSLQCYNRMAWKRPVILTVIPAKQHPLCTKFTLSTNIKWYLCEYCYRSFDPCLWLFFSCVHLNMLSLSPTSSCFHAIVFLPFQHFCYISHLLGIGINSLTYLPNNCVLYCGQWRWCCFTVQLDLFIVSRYSGTKFILV